MHQYGNPALPAADCPLSRQIPTLLVIAMKEESGESNVASGSMESSLSRNRDEVNSNGKMTETM